MLEILQSLLHIYHNFYRKYLLLYTCTDPVSLDKGSATSEGHMYTSYLLWFQIWEFYYLATLKNRTEIYSRIWKYFPTSVKDFKSFLVQLDYRWDSFHNLGHIEYTFYQKIVVGNGIYPFLNMFQASVLANSHMICIFSVFDNSLKDTIDRQNQLHHFDNPHKVLIS